MSTSTLLLNERASEQEKHLNLAYNDSQLNDSFEIDHLGKAIARPLVKLDTIDTLQSS